MQCSILHEIEIPSQVRIIGESAFLEILKTGGKKNMKRNWALINSIVKTIAESDKDIFGVNDFKSAEVSELSIP